MDDENEAGRFKEKCHTEATYSSRPLNGWVIRLIIFVSTYQIKPSYLGQGGAPSSLQIWMLCLRSTSGGSPVHLNWSASMQRSETTHLPAALGTGFCVCMQDWSKYFQKALINDGMAPGNHRTREGFLFCSAQLRVCCQLRVGETFSSNFFFLLLTWQVQPLIYMGTLRMSFAYRYVVERLSTL